MIQALRLCRGCVSGGIILLVGADCILDRLGLGLGRAAAALVPLQEFLTREIDRRCHGLF